MGPWFAETARSLPPVTGFPGLRGPIKRSDSSRPLGGPSAPPLGYRRRSSREAARSPQFRCGTVSDHAVVSDPAAGSRSGPSDRYLLPSRHKTRSARGLIADEALSLHPCGLRPRRRAVYASRCASRHTPQDSLRRGGLALRRREFHPLAPPSFAGRTLRYEIHQVGQMSGIPQGVACWSTRWRKPTPCGPHRRHRRRPVKGAVPRWAATAAHDAPAAAACSNASRDPTGSSSYGSSQGGKTVSTV